MCSGLGRSLWELFDWPSGWAKHLGGRHLVKEIHQMQTAGDWLQFGTPRKNKAALPSKSHMGTGRPNILHFMPYRWMSTRYTRCNIPVVNLLGDSRCKIIY
jgi:hypothetical protein